MRMLTNIKSVLLAAGLFFMATGTSLGQTSDTLSILRDFVAISSGYKHPPLFVEVEMTNHVNLVNSPVDTITIKGRFYLGGRESYIKFGDFEQVVNDTVALIISDARKQMILYGDADSMVSRMTNITGGTVADSSLWSMASKYTASRDDSAIILNSRRLVSGTSFPEQSVFMRFSPQRREPIMVTTTSRSVMLIDSVQYQEYHNMPSFTDNAFIAEGRYFFLKELTTAYSYKKIEHPEIMIIPVRIRDRVTKDVNGRYKPVEGYASYSLRIND